MDVHRTLRFDNIAFAYDTLAALFGGNIKKAQRHYLEMIPNNARILIIGGGTGWILTDILSLEKNLQSITYIEASIKMLNLSKDKLNRYKALHHNSSLPTIEWIQGTENCILQNCQYEVIITHFFLDLFDKTTLLQVMEKLSISLCPGGKWFFSDFNISEALADGWWQRMLLRNMYLFFKITCHLYTKKLPDFEEAFHQLGFVRTHAKSFFRRMIIASIYHKVQ